MLLSNWLRPLRSRIRSRRDSWKAAYAPTDSRTQQAVERLETRLCLSGLTSYSTANSDWFGVVDSSFSSSSGLSGSSSFVGPVDAGAVIRQFLVRLTPEATAQAGSLDGVQELISDNEVELVVTDGLGLPGQVIVSTTERDSVQLVRSLDANSSVAYFEEDFSVGAAQLPSEDASSPEFSRQYGLNNSGQTGGVADVDIDAPEAWDITTGSVETVVSVIDSGVDFTHPDLYLNIWLNQGELPRQFAASLIDANSDELITFRDLNDAANSSFVNDLNGNGYIDAGDLLNDPTWADGIDTDNNGFEDDLVGWDFFENDNKPFDEHRHGTHVAGILGAVGDNGFGVSGVNWQTSIMPLRFLDEDNRGDVSSAVEAINYTTMMRTRAENPVNVRVSNNSWGSSGAFSQTLFDAVAGNERADILFVAAAGNGDVLGQGVNNDDVSFFPANLELGNVVSVAALNDRGELASFSNFGTTTVDIAAPGVGILSTDAGGGFISRSGTSMATPFVAGVGALVFDVFPEATAAEVRDAILSGAVTSGSLDGFIAGSRSLNAFGALTASTFAPVPELLPVATITADGTLSLDITVTYTDDGSVDTSSFDIRDVEITRQGFSETLLTPAAVTTTTVNVGGQDRDAAVYTFTAPGGTFDATENGTWFVSLREGEIQDDLGLYSAPRELGQFTVSIAAANVIFVNTTLDTIDADLDDGVPEDSSGRTSLRAAIMHANQAGAATTIVIPDGVYALTIPGQFEDAATTGDPDLTSTQGITIVGGGAFATTIDAQQLDRVFDVAIGATATIQGVSLRNGNASEGGGIRNAGTLTIDSSIIADNTADAIGGGIYSTGILAISNSSVEDNQTTSRFFGLGGGGLAVFGASDSSAGQTSIHNTSIVNNTSSETGGGVLAVDAELALTNVTVSGNTAQRGDGGGLLLRTTDASKSSLLTSVTVTKNDALSANGGGLATDTASPQVTLNNSIVTDNLAGVSPDVEGRIISDGTNLFGQPSETNTDWRILSDDVADFDQIGTSQSPLDVGLGPLTRNSGIVQSHSPAPNGSAANSDVAGTADLTLTPGLPIVYSTAELEPNNSRGQAMRLDDRGWSLDSDPDIANSTTIPHVTIDGTGDGTFDYYSFTVTEAGATAVFDIDNASLSAGQVFDTELFLIDSNDNLLASSDNDSGDTGSSSINDSRIEHTFAAAGYYTIAVGASDSTHNGSSGVEGAAPPLGSRYTLHVSVQNHELAATTYNATSADQSLFPVDGAASNGEYVFAARQGNHLFAGIRAFDTGSFPSSVALGDINGDGINDIVTSNLIGDSLSILTGNGDGTFEPGVDIAAGDSPSSVTLRDINGDGFDDIVYANPFSNSVSVIINNGDGQLQPAQSFSTGMGPRTLSVADFTGDGIDDIATLNDYSRDISILAGDGEGAFQPPINISSFLGEDSVTRITASSIQVANLNNDDKPDIIILVDLERRDFNAPFDFMPLGSDTRLFLQTSEGIFEEISGISAGVSGNLSDLETADINGDGLTDFVVTDESRDRVTIARSIGPRSLSDGEFSNTTMATGENPISIRIGDVDGDGIDDIVTASGKNYSSTPGMVSILRGQGDGTFQSANSIEVGDRLVSLALNDVTGDGIADVVVADADSSNVKVLPIKQDGTFPQSQDDFDAGTRPSSVFVGDIDGDGIDDIVTANAGSPGVGDVTVLKGDGNGIFEELSTLSAGDGPAALFVGDVTGDGLNDIVTADSRANTVSILRAENDGSIQLRFSFATGANPQSVVGRDVNGDGIVDLVTANSEDDTVGILIGTGQGEFQAFVSYPAGDGPGSLKIVDLTGDGISDIVTANSGTPFVSDGNVSILPGNGDGTFDAPQFLQAGTQPVSIAIEDVSGDGIDDIVVANAGQLFFEDGSVSVLRGEGGGIFAAAEKFDAGSDPVSVAVGDVNGDGILDITTANRNSDTVGILQGTGNGLFAPVQMFDAGNGPVAISVNDVDGDGTLDVVTANAAGNSVSVLEGNSTRLLSFPASESPTMTSIPSRGQLILLGDAFGETFWVADEGVEDELVLWSASEGNGVRERARFTIDSSADAPKSIYQSGSFLIIQSDLTIREFEPTSNQLVTRKIADGTFTTATTYAAETGGGGLAVVDLDNDGNGDVVTQSGTILQGDGQGVFRVTLTELFSGLFRVNDITGDDILDIVVFDSMSPELRFLGGNGNGTFNSAQLLDEFPGADQTASFDIGDVSGDGLIDIVSVTGFRTGVTVVRGLGDDSFEATTFIRTDLAHFSVAIGDVDSDGFNDIVTANLQDDSVSVVKSNGDGTFQASVEYPANGGPFFVEVEDINGDGILDIVTSNEYSNEVSVLIGSGDGTFEQANNFLTGNSPNSVAIRDVNGDGIADLVTANRGTDDVSVLEGIGDGTFQPAVNFSVGSSPRTVISADVNNDGTTDLVTANADSNDISVLLGRSSAFGVITVSGHTVNANRGSIQVRQDGKVDFQPLEILDFATEFGTVRRRDYEFVQIVEQNDKLVATVRLSDTTTRPGELQLLLIDTPVFDEVDALLSSAVENLTFSSALRLTGGEDRQLFVNGDTIYLTAEIVGSGLGDELLIFDRTRGLRLAGDLLPGPESSQVRDFIAVGDDVYFTALASRVNNITRQTELRRELFVLKTATGNVRAVRAGQEVTGKPSLVGSTLFFNSALESGSPNQLLSYDTTQDGVPSIGAFEPVTGDVSGVVFLDRNADGRRNAGEPGRPGVTLFVDVNNNGRREAGEPFAVTRLDDPATSEDESGQYEFSGLPAGDVRIREVPQAGFNQTSPLQVLETAPQLTLIDSATPDPGNSGLGLPSVIGGNLVFVDQTNAPASQLVVNGEAVDLIIPDEAVAIQSLGSVHAQDGASIVFTARLVDGRELVLERDSRGDIRVIADTGQTITSQPLGGIPSSTTLTDIQNGLNGGFDTLSISGGSVGFLAQSDEGDTPYFLGGISDGRFAEFTSGQATLDGDNEIFVDRVVEETGVVLTGSDLFLDKATLDVQVGGNTGWRITTRSGDEILPLTFFDRIFDVSVSGQSALFRASSVSGDESIFLASVDGGITRLIDASTLIPDQSESFTALGAADDNTTSPSVALDGGNSVFVGGGDFAAGDIAFAVAVGDVTGDGLADIVTANQLTDDVSVLRGVGDGAFEPAQKFAVGLGPFAVALDDVTGDGILDIVTANGFSSDVSVLVSDLNGAFQASQEFSVGDFPETLALGDVTGDGILDIVTGNSGSFDVSVLVGNNDGGGNGDGTFQAAQQFAVTDAPDSISLGDVTGDGVIDIVTSNESGDANILEGNGNGTFQAAQSFAVGADAFVLSLGDVTGDGILDIVTANGSTNDISVLVGNDDGNGKGDGTFQAAVNFAIGGDNPGSISLTDVTGDGILDAITANLDSDNVSLLTGNGDGSFQPAKTFSVGSFPFSFSLGDITGEGSIDIVTSNLVNENMSVLTGDGSGNFSRFPAQLGLYARIGGENLLRKIVDRMDFPGQTLTDLAISHDAINGDSIVFRASFSDGTEGIYLAELPAEPVATVTVVAGETASGVLFGASAEPGTIRGTSFTDSDVNGVFDAGEEGNVGRTVFLDANLNGQLDDSEISTVTDSNGEFVFSDLASETEYVVREVLPAGLAVTVPQTLAAATVRLGAAGTVEVVLGSVDSGALGNSADGVVTGVIFNDVNGDGERGNSSAEPGIPNLTVFVDENGDGILNGGERSSTTTADGSYTIDQLRGIQQAVRVVLPGATTDQTSPLGNSFTKATLRTVDSPVEVVTGDFNGDGRDDVATTINQASEVRFFFSDGVGGFVAGDSIEVSGGPGAVEVGSFLGSESGDGLVIGHRTTSSVKVLIPQEDRSFNTVDLITPQDVQTGGQYAGLGNAPYMVTTGDFNADGKDDIAVASQNALPAGGAVAVFLSDGDGTFTHEQTLTLPRIDADFPTAITAGLISLGGTVDLAISNLGTANVTILTNSGVGGSNRFSIDQNLPVGGKAPSSVQLGDLDGDGDNEIVTTNLLSNNVSIFDNKGDGTFETARVLSAGRGPAFAELIDLDQNGSLDIAFTNSDAGNRFGILRNRGDGTFLAAETSGLALLSDGTLAFSLAIGQFDDDNGDGIIDSADTPDVVVSNRSGESLNATAGSLTVGLNAIVPGALSVELPTDTRTASGLNIGLRTINLPPTISAAVDPDAIDEDADQQTVVVSGITTGGETETLQVTVASDNTSLIAPAVTFDANAGTATVRYTPSDDLSGTARITVTVRDVGINGAFNAGDADSDDGVVTASFNVVVNPVNDLPKAEADTFGVLLENGATNLNVLANDNLANPDTGEPLTILITGQPDSGSVVIVNAGQQLQYTPADGFIGQETFIYIVSDSQDTVEGSVTVNVTSTIDPGEPTQIVSAERTELFALPGETVSFDLKYDTSDADSSLSGLSFRLHFDSSKLSWGSASNVLNNGFDFADAGAPEADSSNFDGDAATDSFVLFNFVDNDLQFPGQELPATLATVTFNVSESLDSPTPITFSGLDTALTDDQLTFYEFASVTSTIAPRPVNLDVDDDGRVRANTDGLTILRYLLGQRGEDLARTVFLGGNRTDPAEIATFLDAGLGSMLDVDDDGRARANTDGLTMLRYMLGQDNTDLVRTIFLGGQRTAAADVRSHLEAFDPTVAAVSSASTAARPAPVINGATPAASEPTESTLQFRSPFSQGRATSELEVANLLEAVSSSAPASPSEVIRPNVPLQNEEDSAFDATVDAMLTANEWIDLI